MVEQRGAPSVKWTGNSSDQVRYDGYETTTIQHSNYTPSRTEWN